MMKLADHLPAVETCCIEGVGFFSEPLLEPASCHFKTVRIHRSHLDSSALSHIIRCCKELWEFFVSGLSKSKMGELRYHFRICSMRCANTKRHYAF